MDNDYFNGRYGMGTPDYDNRSWQIGHQDRQNDINRQQEEQRAAERQRNEESLRAWSEAMKPPPAPGISWPTPSPARWAGGTGGSDYSPAASPSRPSVTDSALFYPSTGGGYYTPSRSLWERFVYLICTPFRWAWALIKFAAKAALVILLLLAAVYVAVNGTKRGATSSSAPVEAQTQPTFVAPAPTLVAPADEAPGIVAPTDAVTDEAPTLAAPTDEALAAEAPTDEALAAEAPTDEALAGEAPTDEVEAPTVEAPEVETPETTASPFLGLGARVRDLSSEDLSQLGLSQDQRGTLVVSVLPDSPAADARLQPNDLIISLNFEDVSNGDGFIELVRNQRSGVEVPIAFYRSGIKHTKNITPTE